MINTSETAFQADMVTVKKLCQGLGAACSPVSVQGARRNLFGAGADGTLNLAEQLAEQVMELAQRSSRVWNFDFVGESPIPGGRYQWERVPGCDVPRWYTLEREHLKKKVEAKKFFPKDCFGDKYNKPSLFQTSIKGFSKVQKKRFSKRLRSKHLVQGRCLVADYILPNAGMSQCS